jgi:hypothetical protein
MKIFHRDSEWRVWDMVLGMVIIMLEKSGARWLAMIIRGILCLPLSFFLFIMMHIMVGLGGESGTSEMIWIIVIPAIPAGFGIYLIIKGILMKLEKNRLELDLLDRSGYDEEAEMLERSFYDPELKRRLIERKAKRPFSPRPGDGNGDPTGTKERT